MELTGETKKTAQEQLNTMVNHLVNQGGQSVDDVGACMYRTYDGKMCAIGCLIPDHLYRPDMEHSAVNYNLIKDAGLNEDLYIFYCISQEELHDQYTTGFVDSFESFVMKGAEYVAGKFGLEVPEVNTK